jgi:hypothetical protein
MKYGKKNINEAKNDLKQNYLGDKHGYTWLNNYYLLYTIVFNLFPRSLGSYFIF